LIENIIERFDNSKSYADLTMMFLDLMSCPYIDDKA